MCKEHFYVQLCVGLYLVFWIKVYFWVGQIPFTMNCVSVCVLISAFCVCFRFRILSVFQFLPSACVSVCACISVVHFAWGFALSLCFSCAASSCFSFVLLFVLQLCILFVLVLSSVCVSVVHGLCQFVFPFLPCVYVSVAKSLCVLVFTLCLQTCQLLRLEHSLLYSNLHSLLCSVCCYSWAKMTTLSTQKSRMLLQTCCFWRER